ncbi:MAG: cytochrome c [Albidovulum sp.]|nr:cytochrome c [Albidovulum sp.]MDE0530298.1 cytochrome c [Albidovulum sp.]
MKLAVAAGIFSVAVVVAFLAWSAVNPGRISETELAEALPAGFAGDPDKGELLFHIGGCADCHAPTDGFGGESIALGSGDPLETRFGVFRAPNISPDPEYGIGGWSDADFVNAMFLGISPAGKHYYPAFPYEYYSKATFADILHLKAFLDTLSPDSATSPKHDLRFPFNIRIGLAAWKALFFRPASFVAEFDRSDEWNRGAYIVEGFGHCGSCHTPRSVFLSPIESKKYSGAPPIKEGEKAAPRIAGLDQVKILNGLDEWAGSVSENSSMFLVTKAFTNYVSYEDQDAVAAYLSSLPAN